jgi:hypothetical protein
MARRKGWILIDSFFGEGGLLADGMGQDCTVSMTVMDEIRISDPEDVVEIRMERWFVVPTPEQARAFLDAIKGAGS